VNGINVAYVEEVLDEVRLIRGRRTHEISKSVTIEAEPEASRSRLARRVADPCGESPGAGSAWAAGWLGGQRRWHAPRSLGRNRDHTTTKAGDRR
jgi:hypothetical protein